MTKFLKEILGQPQAITSTAAFYDTEAGSKALNDAVNALRSARRIVAIGMGSSYFLAEVLPLSLARHGIAVNVLNAGEMLHYAMEIVTPDTLLIAISQSGESFETVNVLKQLDRQGVNPKVIAITNEPESTLGRRADILLPTVAGVEEKTSTKTFITAFQLLYMIERRLAGTEIPTDTWTSLAAAIETQLNQRSNVLSDMLRALGNASFLQFIARGTLMATARQSALMAMEASHTPAAALAGGEFRHGPLEMVGDGFTAIVIAQSASPTAQQIHNLIADITKYGGKVLFITDGLYPGSVSAGLTVINVPPTSPDLFPISAIIPVQIAIEAWARTEKGITPGEFTHGAKVTSIE